MLSRQGVEIVLTASATEMSDFFNNPFLAFVGGFLKGPIPLWLARKHQCLEKTHDPKASEEELVLDLYCPIE